MTEIVTLPERAVRPRFTLMLPCLFAAGVVLGAVWPGHGNQLFCIGALPGVWACYVVDASGEADSWLVPALIGGIPIQLLLGRLLDALETDLRLWFIASVVFAAGAMYVLLQGFPELHEALRYHGSFLALFVCALQLGSYGATLASLAFGAGRSGRG
jgi:hypothetical protein